MNLQQQQQQQMLHHQGSFTPQRVINPTSVGVVTPSLPIPATGQAAIPSQVHQHTKLIHPQTQSNLNHIQNRIMLVR